VARDIAALGYVDDAYAHMFVTATRGGTHGRRHPPLVHRGYWARASATRATVRAFASATHSADVPVNIVNIGAGFDTIAMYANALMRGRVRVVELDHGEVVKGKMSRLRVAPDAERALGADEDLTNVRSTREDSGVMYTIGTAYALVECDVRDVERVEKVLVRSGIDLSAPTLVLAECVLAYLPPGKSNDIVRWFGERVRMGVFMSYDPIEPDDAFGRTMIRNVESRGCAFSGIYDAPDVASAARRFTANAWSRAEAYDMNTIYSEKLDPRERARIERIEWFDEFEEWRLIMGHYCISLGVNGLESFDAFAITA